MFECERQEQWGIYFDTLGSIAIDLACPKTRMIIATASLLQAFTESVIQSSVNLSQFPAAGNIQKYTYLDLDDLASPFSFLGFCFSTGEPGTIDNDKSFRGNIK